MKMRFSSLIFATRVKCFGCRKHRLPVSILVRSVGLSSAPMDSISRIPDDATIMGEVRRAIQKLENGRAAGPDRIQPELLT